MYPVMPLIMRVFVDGSTLILIVIGDRLLYCKKLLTYMTYDPCKNLNMSIIVIINIIPSQLEFYDYVLPCHHFV